MVLMRVSRLWGGRRAVLETGVKTSKSLPACYFWLLCLSLRQRYAAQGPPSFPLPFSIFGTCFPRLSDGFYALQLGALFLLRTRSPWVHRLLHTPWTQNKQYTAITANGEPDSEHGESHDDGTVRRPRQIEAPYSDEPITYEGEQANSSQTTPRAERSQEEVQARVQPSGLHGGQNEWSEERSGER